MIDLHTHSRASDGSDPPGRIPELAAAAQCSAVALTDHDTLAGLPEAARRGSELGITVVPGCEVSCAFAGGSAHVLVYFVADDDSPLGGELGRLRSDRVARNRRLVERLNQLGLDITYEEVVAEAAGEQSAGRPHVAAVLVRHGAADSVPDAFERWLGEGRPAHVPKARVAPVEVARLAAASGGVAVLAHPYSLGLHGDDLAAAVGELADAGFAGLEAIYGSYSPDQRTALANLARRYDLVPTGGSDHHGTVRPEVTVGTGRGDLKVPDAVLERLSDRRPAT